MKKKQTVKIIILIYRFHFQPAVCGECGKEFRLWHRLDAHVLSVHKNEAIRFYCDIEGCDKSYTMKQGLVSHKKMVHSDKPPPDKPSKFMCEECGKAFKASATLKKHSYSHTGIRPFSCTICPNKYLSKQRLQEHMMRHEGIKNHVCAVCGMKKTTAHELRTHMNYHTRELKYPCSICHQIFYSIGNRTRHHRIVHCGIRAYSCPHCNQSFGKSETLKHHIMTHTGEKPHQCEQCKKRFIQKTALQKHMKTHTK